MRLLILTPEYDDFGGGIRTFYRNLAPALIDAGVTIQVIEGSAFHAGARSPRVIDGVEVETLELDRLQRWWDQFPAYAAAPGLRRHLAAAWAMWEQAEFGAGADIVEATDWGFLFVPAAMDSSKPLVVQGHGSVGQISVHDPLRGEEIQGALARLIEIGVLSKWPVLQSCSDANAAFWASETGAGVTMIRPARSVSSPRIGGDPSSRGLVVGRIQRWKGPHVLCEALAHLGEKAPPMDWIGRDTPLDRRDSSTSRSLAAAFPDLWGRRITIQSPVAPDEIARRQSAALFNVVPSTWDVFNYTVAEAMASGRPVIVSQGAGASELITEGENGFLFPCGDSKALAEAIERVLSTSPARLAEIGRAAQEIVCRELDPATIARSRVAAYRAAMVKFREAPPTRIGGWLGDVCRPGTPALVDRSDFLGQFPMAEIARHLGSRASERIGRAVSPGKRQ